VIRPGSKTAPDRSDFCQRSQVGLTCWLSTPIFRLCLNVEELVGAGFHAETHSRHIRKWLQSYAAAVEHAKEDIIRAKELAPALGAQASLPACPGGRQFRLLDESNPMRVEADRRSYSFDRTHELDCG